MAINLPDVKPFNFKQFNNGLTLSDGLGDTLPNVLDKLNTNVNIVANNLREKLQSDRTYYVSVNGLDTNDGLSPSNSLLTFNKCIQIIYKKIDLNGYKVIINVGDGVWTEPIVLIDNPIGFYNQEYSIIIDGNVSDPQLTKLSYTTNTLNCCIYLENCNVLISNLSFSNPNISSVDTSAIKSVNSNIYTDNVEFNSFNNNSYHLYLNNSVLQYKSHKIINNSKHHIYAVTNSIIRSLGTNTWVFESAAVNTLIKVSKSSVSLANTTFTGSVTGFKYEKDYLSVISSTNYPLGLSSGIETPVVIDSEVTFQQVNIVDNLNVSESVVFNKDLSIALNTSIGGNLSVIGSTTLTGLTTLNNVNIQGQLNSNSESLFNNNLKVIGLTELNNTTVKGETTFEKKVTLNQDLIALGSVVLSNGVINRSNLSSSTTSGTQGNNGDVLVINTINGVGGLQWSSRLTDVETNLQAKANLSSPEFTGVPTVPTPARNSNTLQVANTSYVNDLVRYSVNQVMTWVQERIPVKTITAWSGTVEEIKAPWSLCLEGNTLITLSDGRKLRLDYIVENKLEVEVLSFNTVTKQLEPKKVVEWFKTPVLDKSEWITLCAKENQKSKLTLTKSHLVWNPIINDWIKTQYITDSCILLKYKRKKGKNQTRLNGTLINVEVEPDKLSISKYNQPIFDYKYDIKVEDNHTFLANDYVVHNCDGSDGTPDLRSRFIFGAGKQTGTALCINETGGNASVSFNQSTITTSADTVPISLTTNPTALTRDQIPAHTHFNNLTMVYYGGNALPVVSGAGGGKGGSSGTTVGFLTPTNETQVGLGQAHNHLISGDTQAHSHTINLPQNVISTMPPYYVLAYVELKPVTYNFTIS